MGLYEISSLYLGLATLAAAFTVIWYSRTRSATLDSESKKAFRPLYIVAVGIIAYGIGALGIYYEEVTGLVVLFDVYLVFYFGLAIEVILLSIAAAMILDNRKLYAVPAFTVFATVVLFYLEILFPDQMDVILLIGVLAPAAILFFVGGIFVWLAKETKKSTSTTLAFTLIIQILGLPALYFDLVAGSLEIAFVFFLLMGPAMIIFTFLRPEQKVSFELIGYGSSFAGPALILASIQEAGLAANLDIIIIAGLSALAAATGAGTASYLYGRYRETKQFPTGIMAVALFLLADAQIIGTLGGVGIAINPQSYYIEFILTGFALTLLAVGGIYAAGWKSASLLPFLADIPVTLLIMQAYPGDLSDAFLSIWYLIIPTIAVLLLPAFVFIGVWNRMRKASRDGRLRPLGLGIGIILFFLTRIPPLVLGLGGLDIGYGLVFASYFVIWLSMTGRMDRLFMNKQIHL
jgi:hypothetical protein